MYRHTSFYTRSYTGKLYHFKITPTTAYGYARTRVCYGDFIAVFENIAGAEFLFVNNKIYREIPPTENLTYRHFLVIFFFFTPIRFNFPIFLQTERQVSHTIPHHPTSCRFIKLFSAVAFIDVKLPV